jgi:multisubunit Na+/H+ antiporter MnhC subunit
METSNLLSPSLSDVLFGVGLGYLGANLYWVAWSGSSAGFVPPMTYINNYDFMSLKTYLPPVGAYVGFKMGAGNMAYLYGILGGAVATYIATMGMFSKQ